MPPSLPYSWKQMIRTSTGIIHNTSPQLPEQRGHIQCILSTLPPHGRAQWTQDIRQQLKRHRTARSEVHPEQSRITRDPGLEEEKVRPDHAAHDKLGASPHCHFGSIVGVKRLSGIVALSSSIVIATGNSASLLRACSRRRCLRGIVRPAPKTRVGSTKYPRKACLLAEYNAFNGEAPLPIKLATVTICPCPRSFHRSICMTFWESRAGDAKFTFTRAGSAASRLVSRAGLH
mmetsp:Transcript_28853/g.52724  ORF Transcript_28853/g.52724 Transcript_28853/m.52724 type:complete len:232 (-) Transcript_28853:14-709(-)